LRRGENQSQGLKRGGGEGRVLGALEPRNFYYGAKTQSLLQLGAWTKMPILAKLSPRAPIFFPLGGLELFIF